RPTVLDEVRQGLEVVEGALFDVVPRLYRRLQEAVARVYPEYRGRVPALLRFGTWIGGDRDGNPHVTHSNTARAVRMQQEAVLRYYRQQIEGLHGRLSMTEQFAPPTPEFSASLCADLQLVPELAQLLAHEPYRLKCRVIAARLERTREYLDRVDLRWGAEPADPPAGAYLGGHELYHDLTLMAESLRAARATGS